MNKSVRYLVISLSFLSSLSAHADASAHGAAPAQAASASASAHAAPKGTAPDTALVELQAGNQRFIEGKPKHPSQDTERRRDLASGQNPSAVVLSCSDSRVPPELIFDKGLGEIFSIRVAGNNLGAAPVASIEYAVEHLGTRLIVVMGHESCGAIKAALSTPPGKSAGSPDLDQLVSTIHPFIEGANRTLASDDKKFRKPVMMNVDGVAERLVTRSSIIRSKVESGDVKIVRAIYSLETGKVDFWGMGKSELKTSSKTTHGSSEEKRSPASESHAHH